MTTDAKQSLTVFAAVTAIFLFGYLFFVHTRGLQIPRWMTLACLSINAMNFAWWIGRQIRTHKTKQD